MVGLVLVSHSRALAEAARELALAMTGPDIPVAVAAGTGEGRNELGTDAVQILEAIEQVYSDQGVVVLMDMGSAVLSAETALDFLDDAKKPQVFLCAAPFVEGAVAASVTIKMGAEARQVIAEAGMALTAKGHHLQGDPAPDQPSQPQQEALSESTGPTLRVTVPNPDGLHARPAAKLVQEAAAASSRIVIRNLSKNKGPAPATSLTSLVMLEARQNDELEIQASGTDQDVVLERLKVFIESGMGDPLPGTGALRETDNHSREKSEISGENPSPIGISAGVVAGPLYRPRRGMAEPSSESTADAEAEMERLHRGLQGAQKKIQRRAAEISRSMGKEQGGIFEAQSLVLADPVLFDRAGLLIREEHLSASRAWWQAVKETITAYRQLNDGLLRERAADLEDAGREVLAELGFEPSSGLDIPEPGILLVDDLTPAEVSGLNTEHVLGVICLQGSKTSHSGILLRSRGIAAVGKARYAPVPLASIPLPAVVAFDGETGKIDLNPDEDLLREIDNKRREQTKARARTKEESAKAAVTRSGEHFGIFANVGKPADAENAAENGADGIGLLRTEFMFLERAQAPDEAEQYEALCAIAAPMKGKPVVVRTLDAGGDKELPYLLRAPEENPFLGVRAIRLCLQNRILFQTQLRAILRAARDHDIRVMFPMIATLQELAEAKKELARAHEDLAGENIPHRWPLPVGMMMEVPSAALMAGSFAPEVDFVSIGTNDLTQYTLAADRGNMELESLHDPLNPAVLELIRIIVKACHEHTISAAVCGEAAADPKAARIFADLGIRELSMSSRLVPAMKAAVRVWD